MRDGIENVSAIIYCSAYLYIELGMYVYLYYTHEMGTVKHYNIDDEIALTETIINTIITIEWHSIFIIFE